MITTQRLTLKDFLSLANIEESPAWELLQGQAQQKPMPTAFHSILQKWLTRAIDDACSDYEAFPELRCNLAENSVVPNITVIRQERVPAGNTAVEGAPDWMIEILSPDQSTTKLIAQIQTCLAQGTQLGWLVDPAEQVIIVLFPDSRMMLLSQSDTASSPTVRLPVPTDFPLELTVTQVFVGLRLA